MYKEIKVAILELSNDVEAVKKNRYFKSGIGEYAENDVFIGVSNPDIHVIAKHYYKQADLTDVQALIQDEIHEVRLLALTILVLKFDKLKTLVERQLYANFYIENLEYINNWDLVDCSCYKILGPVMYEEKDHSFLEILALNGDLWMQRISLVTTLYFIKKGLFEPTFYLVETLIDHPHDLIHKAMGWMLREAWSRGRAKEVEKFLTENIEKLPRTTLRYSIEKMEDHERQYFLSL